MGTPRCGCGDIMCGIAVAIDWDGAEAAVRSLIAGMLHRGDVTDPLVTLGNNTAMCTRRLRIVDATHGTQPQASFDGRFLVSLNGEIYNHIDIRQELEALGVRFRTGCDTEVVANAMRIWGASGIKRLAGMYAFVAIDTATGEFLAARDPFGVKPLYLIRSGEGFLFCSEIKPLLEAIEKGDVLLLPPGFMLTRNYCGRHYVLPSPMALSASSPAELDRILSDAVRIRLPPALPVSALFSGGIDSTLVVHYARRFRPAMPAYIAVGPDAPDRIYAERYAALTGLDLREVNVDVRSNDTLSLVEAVVDAVETSSEWNSTALFVVWDDFGGFYDDVPPPSIDPLGLSIRVPALVVSPYTPAGLVVHSLHYFESILRFMEWQFHLGCLTPRDCLAPMPWDFFQFNSTPRAPVLFPYNATGASYPYQSPVSAAGAFAEIRAMEISRGTSWDTGPPNPNLTATQVD